MSKQSSDRPLAVSKQSLDQPLAMFKQSSDRPLAVSKQSLDQPLAMSNDSEENDVLDYLDQVIEFELKITDDDPDVDNGCVTDKRATDDTKQQADDNLESLSLDDGEPLNLFLRYMAMMLQESCNDNMLEETIRVDESKRGRPHMLTRFHTLAIPKVTIAEFYQRLAKHTICDHTAYVASIVYMCRLLAAFPDRLVLSSYCVHRLILSTLVVAAKNYSDVCHKNGWMAQVGGITLKEMNLLEGEVLEALKWNGMITRDEYINVITNVYEFARDKE